MAYHWSPSNVAFYADAFRPSYEAQGTWPNDAIAVTDEMFATYTSLPPPGQQRGYNPSTGLPAWVSQSVFVTIDEMLAQLASYRYGRETAGIYYRPPASATALLFATDDRAQAKIAAVNIAGGPAQVRWKTATRWVSMSAADLRSLFAVVVSYIQACYDREEVLATQIRNGGSPDITIGWPSQGP